jgi:hypothetical protein
MKGKKNRKILHELSPATIACSKAPLEHFKIRFDLLKNDISCFISKKATSKNAISKGERSRRATSRKGSVKKSEHKNGVIGCKGVEERETRN